MEWGAGGWLSIKGTGVCVRKEKNGFASESDEGERKKSVLGGISGLYTPRAESSSEVFLPDMVFH